jgi:hypothetical protein
MKCKYEVLIHDVLNSDWDRAYEGKYVSTGRGSSYENFHEVLSNGATVMTVDKHDKDTWGPQYYEGEYPSGSEFPAFVILKVEGETNGPIFFRKNGTANSYGVVSWDGMFQEVKAVKKEVTVFENMYEVV